MAVDVIAWTDDTGEQIVHRHPNDEIRLGAQLTVRESQCAVFFRDGKALDVFGAGRYTLETANIPLLVGLLNIPFGFKRPFKAEVYFINQKVFTDMKWGTREPVWFRDAELDRVRLRAFGTYSIQVEEPRLFINTLVGTERRYSTADVREFLRSVIVTRFNDLLGETVKTLFDLPQLYDELSSAMKTRIDDDLGQYGIRVLDFLIEAITPPEEVQELMDKRTGMAAVGDMDRFMKFQAASALEAAAEQEGGGGGGMAMGAGLGMGVGMGQAIQQAMQTGGGAAQPAAAAPTVTCPKCQAASPAGAKFCVQCGQQLASAEQRFCTECGAEVPAAAKFCPGCGYQQSAD